MITGIRPGAPRFREPDEPRFKPCEGDLTYASTVDLPQIGLVDIEFEIVVEWQGYVPDHGEVDWEPYLPIKVGEKSLPGNYAPHDTSLEAQFWRALRKAILAEHSTRIEERCAEEAGRDG